MKGKGSSVFIAVRRGKGAARQKPEENAGGAWQWQLAPPLPGPLLCDINSHGREPLRTILQKPGKRPQLSPDSRGMAFTI